MALEVEGIDHLRVTVPRSVEDEASRFNEGFEILAAIGVRSLAGWRRRVA
jgi:hypothetical protein